MEILIISMGCQCLTTYGPFPSSSGMFTALLFLTCLKRTINPKRQNGSAYKSLL